MRCLYTPEIEERDVVFRLAFDALVPPPRAVAV